MISIIIPANNEEAMIGRCLESVLASDPVPEPVALIVAANACVDRTVPLARSFEPKAKARGWSLTVLDLPEGGKMHAMNQADRLVAGGARMYLDADVVVDRDLLPQIAQALQGAQPRYASGTVRIAQARSFASRAYRVIYRQVPFFTQDVPGCGVFAVNEPGRARWGDFPDIISDDTFVRLSFAPSERVKTTAGYEWPIVEGFGNLVRVRRRQNVGVAQVARLYPKLQRNDTKPSLSIQNKIGMMIRHPIGFAVYASVALLVKLTESRHGSDWSRGR